MSPTTILISFIAFLFYHNLFQKVKEEIYSSISGRYAFCIAYDVIVAVSDSTVGVYLP